MRIDYDPKLDILYIKLRDAPPVESEHLENDIVIDYDENNDIVGVEILYFSRSAGFRSFLSSSSVM